MCTGDACALRSLVSGVHLLGEREARALRLGLFEFSVRRATRWPSGPSGLRWDNQQGACPQWVRPNKARHRPGKVRVWLCNGLLRGVAVLQQVAGDARAQIAVGCESVVGAAPAQLATARANEACVHTDVA